jgi:integrase
VTNKLDGVHVVTKPLRDGSARTYYYWRATGYRLPPPDDPTFAEEVEKGKAHRTRAQIGTVGAVIEAFRRAPRFAQLAPTTARSYIGAFDRLYTLRDVPIAEIKRKHAITIRETLADTPGDAKVTVKALSMLINFAIEKELCEVNLVRGIRIEGLGERRRWTDEAIAFALARLPEYLRRAMVLALGTGQRRGDCAAMRWSQYDGEGIALTQIKTKRPLWVGCDEDLRAEMDAWKKTATAVTILTNAKGRPWASSNSLGSGFAEECRRFPALDGFTFHGLRKTAAARLAEAGCTTFEVAAVTGHRSLGMVEHYTKEAQQKTRAQAAVVKLETARRNQRKLGT